VSQARLCEHFIQQTAVTFPAEVGQFRFSPSSAEEGCDTPMHTCPVCWFSSLPYPARDYHICPCCGTEFGNDDAELTWEELRQRWILGGMHWFFGEPPRGWNPQAQLLAVGYGVKFSAGSEGRPKNSELRFA
jgi:hypothetical protein